jgi:di/tricarboxylate transporter
VNVVEVLPAGMVHVTVCELIEHPGALLMVRLGSMVSETVATAVVAPLVVTVSVMTPGPPWKIGLACVAAIASVVVMLKLPVCGLLDLL